MKQETRVFIVDDDAGVREGLQMLLESAGHTVVALAEAESFLEHYEPDKPSCLILDLRLPKINGLQLQQKLAQRGTPPPIIFLTGHASVPTAVKALKDGAIDYFQKPVTNEQQLLERVAEAIDEDCKTRARATEHEKTRQLFERLTPREAEVMEQLCEGKANKVVAVDLGISERTVELHRAHLMKKLGIRSVAELIHIRDILRKA